RTKDQDQSPEPRARVRVQSPEMQRRRFWPLLFRAALPRTPAAAAAAATAAADQPADEEGGGPSVPCVERAATCSEARARKGEKGNRESPKGAKFGGSQGS